MIVGAIAQVRTNGVNVYPDIDGGGNKYATFHTRTGDIDEQKKRRFRKYARLLLFLSDVKIKELTDGRVLKFRLNFITLTLPFRVIQGDRLESSVALCFQKLRNAGVRHYIWRKEKQPGTQNLHWHIISNAWIDKNDLSKYWADSLAKHCPGMMRHVMNKYKTIYYAPSTNVRAVQAIRGAMRDLEKYLQTADKVEGNSFGVSRALSQIPYLTIDANHPGLERTMAIGKRLDQEWSSFYALPTWTLLRSLNSELRQAFNTWKETHRLD